MYSMSILQTCVHAFQTFVGFVDLVPFYRMQGTTTDRIAVQANKNKKYTKYNETIIVIIIFVRSEIFLNNNQMIMHFKH